MYIYHPEISYEIKEIIFTICILCMNLKNPPKYYDDDCKQFKEVSSA